jgi:hypothetical protein
LSEWYRELKMKSRSICSISWCGEHRKKAVFDDKVVFYDELQAGLLSVPIKMKVENEVPFRRLWSFRLRTGRSCQHSFILLPCRSGDHCRRQRDCIFLTRMAKMLGFTVVIVDPRAMFATRVRFLKRISSCRNGRKIAALLET